MESISLEFIANSTDGTLKNPANVMISGVSTDTRTLKDGDLYIALIGDRFDGHDFIDKALKNGASAILSSRENISADAPFIYVRDTLEALQNLAAAYRKLFRIPVIAITGSHGKTTTKDLIAQVLSSRFTVHSTYRNLNGLIGVPLTVLGLDHAHEILVIETGISKPGEMDILGRIVQPTIGLFTCAAMAHTEFLKDMAMIVTEKSKLFEYLQPDGIRVINIDDPNLAILAGSSGTMTYGFSEADVQGKILNLAPGQSEFMVTTATSGPRTFNLPLPGEFNILNALAAISMGMYFGLTREEIQKGLNRVKLSPHRCALEVIHHATIIDDSYNAAPTSMLMSLEMLARLKSSSRTIAVLGDMLELGAHAETAHRRIGQTIVTLGIDLILTFGDSARHITAEAGDRGVNATHYDSKKDLANALIQVANPGDVILFKASRSMAAEQIIEMFRNQ